MMDVLSANFPERLHKIFVFRPPENIDKLIKLITPIVD